MISVSQIQFHIPIPMRFTSTTRNLFSYYLFAFSGPPIHFRIKCIIYVFLTNFVLFRRFNIMDINLKFNIVEQADTACTTYREAEVRNIW